MFLDQEEISKLEDRYGRPREISFGEIKMQEDEFDLLRRSMEGGRAHDVTIFTFVKGEVVVIQKPSHPPKVFRAPGGGVEPCENIEDGIRREMYEETGLEIEIERYVLRTMVTFVRDTERRDWTSHVFLASKVGGRLNPKDTEEVAKARLVSSEKLLGGIRDRMLESGRGGLIYRAKLTDAFFEEVNRQGYIS